MKPSTIHSLLTARTLYEEANRLIESNDRHMCSAGLVILQDALEIVLLAMLTEKDVDEQKALESKTFDELIGELGKLNIKVPKSGTLKALNKQRVITKHYGQLAEPVTVRNYAEAADIAVSKILIQVLGKDFHEIFLSDLLDPGEAKDFLDEAVALLEQGESLQALTAVRKALFVEIEDDYTIHKYSDVETNELFDFLTRGGTKAPYWTRNKDWIMKNVKNPIDYVQIDHERLRLDAMEWGVNTVELKNLRHLTPNVFRSDKEGSWHIGYDKALLQMVTPENARYCLDRAISILIRKQQHTRAQRRPSLPEWESLKPKNSLAGSVFEQATQQSKVVHQIQSDYEYKILKVVTGFNPDELFWQIMGSKPDSQNIFGSRLILGYILVPEEDAE